MPLTYRKLGGNNGRLFCVVVFGYLTQSLPNIIMQRLKSKIIGNQYRNFFDSIQLLRVTSIPYLSLLVFPTPWTMNYSPFIGPMVKDY